MLPPLTNKRRRFRSIHRLGNAHERDDASADQIGSIVLRQILAHRRDDGAPGAVRIQRRFESAHGSLRTDRNGDLTLRNLPAGTYQFWPYANELEAESILAYFNTHGDSSWMVVVTMTQSNPVMNWRR